MRGDGHPEGALPKMKPAKEKTKVKERVSVEEGTVQDKDNRTVSRGASAKGSKEKIRLLCIVTTFNFILKTENH